MFFFKNLQKILGLSLHTPLILSSVMLSAYSHASIFSLKDASPDLSDVLILVIGGLLFIAMYWYMRRKVKESARLRKELERQEQETRLMLEHAPFPVVLTRLSDGKIDYVNARAVELFDSSVEEMLKHSSADFYVDPTQRKDLIERVIQDGRILNHEMQLQNKNKDKHDVLLSCYLSTRNSQPVLFTAFSDVTHLKKVEKELSRRELQLRHLLAEAPAPIIVCRRNDLTIRYINLRATEVFEETNSAAQGQIFSSFFVNSDDLQKLNQQRDKNGWISRFEAQLKTAQGTPRWFLISSQFGEMDDHEATFFSFNDITELKESSEALHAMNIKLSEQIEEIQSLQSALQEQVMRDSLTKLYNRRYLDDAMERELSLATREGNPVSVIILDIDHFKQVNDVYGHQAGDEVLRQLGALMRELTRASDIPCRMGGEEFLVLLPKMGLNDAIVRAELIRTRFAEKEIQFGQLSICAKLSAGVACYPAHGRSASELIRHADAALYRAKQNGRNQVAVATLPSLSS